MYSKPNISGPNEMLNLSLLVAVIVTISILAKYTKARQKTYSETSHPTHFQQSKNRPGSYLLFTSKSLA